MFVVDKTSLMFCLGPQGEQDLGLARQLCREGLGSIPRDLLGVFTLLCLGCCPSWNTLRGVTTWQRGKRIRQLYHSHQHSQRLCLEPDVFFGQARELQTLLLEPIVNAHNTHIIVDHLLAGGHHHPLCNDPLHTLLPPHPGCHAETIHPPLRFEPSQPTIYCIK